MLTYVVNLEPQKDGGYTVTVPALKGCVSEGETIDEALSNIREAITLYLQSLIEHKKSIPMEFPFYREVQVSLDKTKNQKITSPSLSYA